MDPMNRVTVDIGPSQTNAPITNAAHKRKAPESEGNGQGDAKRTQPSRRAKKVATPQNVAGLTPTPGLASATLSKAPQQQSQPLPFPAGFPPVSSDIRAALCDTLPYWKVHQGGIQSKHNVASGMLLNGKTTSRDVVQSQVVITTVGGGFDTIGAKLIRIEDQREKSRNHIVLKGAMDIAKPVAVIAGKQTVKGSKGRKRVFVVNNLFSVELERRYNVLAWFHITDIWTEYQPIQSNGTRYKHYVIRLEKINLDSPSWWSLPGNAASEDHAVDEFHCSEVTCRSCYTPSQEIFKEGWCCLEKSCVDFFRFSNATVDIDSLQYNENFLNKRKGWTGAHPLPPLAPALPTIKGTHFGSEAQYKGGIVCPTCKIACRRMHWNGWTCEKECGFAWHMPPQPVSIEHVQGEVQSHMGGRGKYYEVDPLIERVAHNVQGYEATTFYLPNTPNNSHEAEFVGSVTIFRPLKATLERPEGLNDLLGEIQRDTRNGDIALRRHPARCKGSHQEELTSHFSMNIGADYKFGVAVETSSGFDSAPAPIMKALSRLTWGGSTAVGLTTHDIHDNERSVDHQSMPGEFTNFNEQLMLGYFEGSRISYHDDGERELGPTVATLSLGSPSTMRFRAKAKSGIRSTVAAGRVMLSMFLEHGDMVIMHGTKIHQYYEHTVLAGGVQRYALTCRYIRPEMIPDPKRREKAMVNGKVPVYWQKKAYKGETAEAVIETAIPQQQWLHTGRGTVSLAEIQNSVEALDDDDDDDDDDVEIRGQVDRVIDNEVFPMEDTIDTSSVVSESDSIASNTTTLVGQHYKIPYDTYDRLMSSTRELINTIQANEGIVEDLEPAAKVSMRILSDLLADELGT